ncbi:hypothetical protein [Streptomyces sp. NBC_01264]|uniref:hypothetical protein n=1 Tax=Streptomyces sp. NBC_01264 TaxID=2903804 RepID=UPI0022581E72|nr:hypothetical protein [Streptomyces sp. NBC_01264]MCX4783401.1 hypothetical protein [Streptomyces sp. NBC_01264]
MNPTENINHDAVLRARVALLGSGTLPVRERVAAYRVLVQVSPLAYLPLLAVALYAYSRQEFAHRPGMALALRAESVAAARRMCALEPGETQLLLSSLVHYREQLLLTERPEELASVEAEMSALVASGGGSPGARWDLSGA